MGEKVEFVDFSDQANSRTIDRAQVSRYLQERNLLIDVTGAPFVTLRPSNPQVPDRGWLEFVGMWNVFSKPPDDRADCFGLSVDYPGKLNIWLTNLTSGTKYIVAIDVLSGATGLPSAYRIGTSAGAPRTVTANGDQSLLLQIEPTSQMELVTLTTQNLPDSFSFYSTEVYRVK